jgi:hypothetical protein
MDSALHPRQKNKLVLKQLCFKTILCMCSAINGNTAQAPAHQGAATAHDAPL